MVQNEGFRYDGFWGWERTAVGDFIETKRRATRGDKGGRVVLIAVA